MSNFGLLLPDFVEILLLDSLLLNSLLLLLELESDLFLLNFLQLSLNKSVVDFTILGRLNLLKKCGLLVQFVLASSLRSCIGRDVILRGVILASQFLRQNGKLLLRIVNGANNCGVNGANRFTNDVLIRGVNAVAVTTNESNCACLTRTTYTIILRGASRIATAETGCCLQTEAAVVHALTLQNRCALNAISGTQETWSWLSAIVTCNCQISRVKIHKIGLILLLQWSILHVSILILIYFGLYYK